MDMDIEMDGAEQKTPKADSSLNTPIIATAPNAMVRRRVKFSEMTPDQIAITEIRNDRRVPSWSDLTTVDASSLSPGKYEYICLFFCTSLPMSEFLSFFGSTQFLYFRHSLLFTIIIFWIYI